MLVQILLLSLPSLVAAFPSSFFFSSILFYLSRRAICAEHPKDCHQLAAKEKNLIKKKKKKRNSPGPRSMFPVTTLFLGPPFRDPSCA